MSFTDELGVWKPIDIIEMNGNVVDIGVNFTNEVILRLYFLIDWNMWDFTHFSKKSFATMRFYFDSNKQTGTRGYNYFPTKHSQIVKIGFDVFNPLVMEVRRNRGRANIFTTAIPLDWTLKVEQFLGLE